MKKVVDKRKNLWYPIRVADEDNEQERKRLSDSEPWQMNSNATLKIPDQESGSADLKEFQRTKPKDSKPENKTGKPDIWQEGFLKSFRLFNMRVWSWLRMNAGGVPNTCKSNGLNMKPSDC